MATALPGAGRARHGVLTLVLPIDPVAALIAFGSLTVRRVDRMTVALGGLLTVATFVTRCSTRSSA